MAFGKTAGCIILAGAAMASAAQFTVRHEHWQDHCSGVLTVDDKGVSSRVRRNTPGTGSIRTFSN